jgi:UDP-N-acetylmuramoyl-tripeptide--D-alanyl-D-alanine ligase
VTTWTSDQVATALGVSAPAKLTFSSVATDTRNLIANSLFVALKGNRFDAHDFLGQAKAAGATGAVVRRGTPAVAGLTLFEVADTLTALGLLARARRRLLPKDAPVVAVTGSSGKTSAKEMIRSALATQRRVHATSGNLNNLVGVPLTILSAPDDANALVVEAGASLPGEIGKLRDIIEPTIAVVTNVGFAHLEGFGTTERLLQEKASLLDGAPVAVVGNSPALVAQAQRRARKVVVVARDEFGEVHPDKVDVDDAGQPILHWMGTSVTLPVLGLHQVDNAMIALAVAREAGVDLKAAVAGLANVQIPAGRGGLVSKGSLTIMDDSYNANPDSILAALETALTYAARRRRPLVVVLGSMLELGPESARLHAFVADELMSFLPAPEVVAAVGDFVPAFARYREALGERLITAPDAETLGPLLKRALRGNEIVLLKASRGVALERVLRHLT